MKRVFRVTLHMNDGSKEVFRTMAKNDVEARSKSEARYRELWDGVDGKFPGVDFAEIEWVCDIDAG